jgi:hypothetical protein
MKLAKASLCCAGLSCPPQAIQAHPRLVRTPYDLVLNGHEVWYFLGSSGQLRVVWLLDGCDTGGMLVYGVCQRMCFTGLQPFFAGYPGGPPPPGAPELCTP